MPISGSRPAPPACQGPGLSGLDQWAPQIYVDDLTGEITVVYYDRRNDPLNTLMEVWASRSIDCGLTWTDCLVSDAGPTPPVSTFGIPPIPVYLGDYLGTDFNALNGPGFIWNDGRNGANQDILFESVPVCDTDGDGIFDIFDNCPLVFNPGQADTDGDGIGDACDACTDTDGDGFGDPGFPANTCPTDNCPSIPNPSQADADGDGIGDVCDACTDTDGDGFGDPGFPANTCPTDNCPSIPNPSQADADVDGIGDVCDACTDTDGDGFGNPGFPANTCLDDNCPSVPNPGQADLDFDGIGDACDPDIDGDGLSNADEATAGTNPNNADSDGDNVDDFIEVFVDGGSIGSPTDTDSDGTINALDNDDDDDGVPTASEDPNGNGDPTDDDSDGDTIPDYLDPDPAFLCGDADGSGGVDIDDPFYLIAYIFKGGPAPS